MSRVPGSGGLRCRRPGPTFTLFQWLPKFPHSIDVGFQLHSRVLMKVSTKKTDRKISGL